MTAGPPLSQAVLHRTWRTTPVPELRRWRALRVDAMDPATREMHWPGDPPAPLRTDLADAVQEAADRNARLDAGWRPEIPPPAGAGTAPAAAPVQGTLW